MKEPQNLMKKLAALSVSAMLTFSSVATPILAAAEPDNTEPANNEDDTSMNLNAQAVQNGDGSVTVTVTADSDTYFYYSETDNEENSEELPEGNVPLGSGDPVTMVSVVFDEAVEKLLYIYAADVDGKVQGKTSVTINADTVAPIISAQAEEGSARFVLKAQNDEGVLFFDSNDNQLNRTRANTYTTEELGDGEYAYYARDAVGNKSNIVEIDNNVELTVSVEGSKVTLSATKPAVFHYVTADGEDTPLNSAGLLTEYVIDDLKPDGDYKFYAVNIYGKRSSEVSKTIDTAVVGFTASIDGSNVELAAGEDVTFYYTVSGSTTPTALNTEPDSGFKGTLDDNTYTFYAVDAFGNESNKIDGTIDTNAPVINEINGSSVNGSVLYSNGTAEKVKLVGSEKFIAVYKTYEATDKAAKDVDFNDFNDADVYSTVESNDEGKAEFEAGAGHYTLYVYDSMQNIKKYDLFVDKAGPFVSVPKVTGVLVVPENTIKAAAAKAIARSCLKITVTAYDDATSFSTGLDGNPVVSYKVNTGSGDVEHTVELEPTGTENEYSAIIKKSDLNSEAGLLWMNDFKVKAYDKAGNSNESTYGTLLYNTQAPNVSVNQGEGNANKLEEGTYTFDVKTELSALEQLENLDKSYQEIKDLIKVYDYIVSTQAINFEITEENSVEEALDEWNNKKTNYENFTASNSKETATITFTPDEDTKYLYVYAIDTLGNVSNALVLYGDNDAPKFNEKAAVRDGDTIVSAEQYTKEFTGNSVTITADIDNSYINSNNEYHFVSDVKGVYLVDAESPESISYDEAVKGTLFDGGENGKYTLQLEEEQAYKGYVCVADKAGNVAVYKNKIEVNIDKTKPTVALGAVSANSWSSKDITVRVDSGDNKGEVNSGISKCYFVDTAKLPEDSEVTEAWLEANATPVSGENHTFSAEEQKNYSFFAVDNVGNVSTAASTDIWLDKTKPVINSIGTASQGFSNNSITIEYDISDPKKSVKTEEEKTASGYNGAYYSKKLITPAQGGELTAGELLKLLDAEDENDRLFEADSLTQHKFNTTQDSTYYFYFTDRAGNVSVSEVINVQIDQTGLMIAVKNQHDKEWINYSNDIEITVTQDASATSSISNIYYSTEGIDNLTSDTIENNPEKFKRVENKTTEGKITTGKVTFSADQDQEYYFYAVNNAGTVIRSSATTVKIDTTKPVVKLTNPDDNKWVNKGVDVTVSDSHDNGTVHSGIVKYYYVTEEKYNTLTEDGITLDWLDNAENATEIEGDRVTFNTEQDVKYYFYVVDDAGNISDIVDTKLSEDKNATVSTVKIDTTKPVAKLSNPDDNKWVNKGVNVTVSDSHDNNGTVHSGIVKYYYVTEEKYNTLTENGITLEWLNNTENATEMTGDKATFNTDQNVKYYFYAVDEAGNISDTFDTVISIDENSTVSTVKIDTAEPVVNLVNTSDSKWVNHSVTVDISGSNDNDGTVHSGNVKYYVVEKSHLDPMGINGVTVDWLDDANNATPVTEGSYTFNEDQNKVYYFFGVDEAGNISKTFDQPNDDKTKLTMTNVRIERTQPKITNATIENAEIYKFGAFSRGMIKIKISVSDTDSQLISGINKVTMLVGDEKKREFEFGLDTDNNGDAEKNDIEFTIPYTDTEIDHEKLLKDILYNNIRFDITDQAGNKLTGVNITAVINDLKEKSDNVLSDQTAPIVNDIALPTPVYTNDGRLWYNYDNITASSHITDLIPNERDSSGIKEYRISTANQSTNYEINDGAAGAEHTADPSVTSVTEDVDADGRLDFYAYAADLAENTDERRATVYVDTKAPVITGFSVNGVSINGSKDTYVIDAISNTTRTVTITAADTPDTHTGASGVRQITYTLHDVNGTTTSNTVNVVNDAITFNVDPNFKGYISAYATDNTNNSGAVSESGRFIAENQSMHNSSSSINFSIPNSSVKVNGNNLYGSDIDVTFDITSSYAGIKSATYEIKDPNASNSSSVGARLESTATELNLMTGARQTVKVSNNSNDIEFIVTVVDNAGNTSKNSIFFSIDKTAPKIEVAYDNNSKNAAFTDKNYYKANRQATVTITERNFNAADVVTHITSSEGNVPVISGFRTVTGSTPDDTKHIATILFSEDADYELGIDFKDMIGHAANSYGTDKFTVDKTLPTVNSVNISSTPENGKYYNTDLTVSVNITEHNFDRSLVKIATVSGTLPEQFTNWTDNGDEHVLTFNLSEDDIYAFTVSLDDKAANSSQLYEQEEFVIDHLSPEVRIDGVEDGKAYGFGSAGNVQPILVFNDINLNNNMTYTINKVNRDGTVRDVTSEFTASTTDFDNGTRRDITIEQFKQVEAIDGIYRIDATGYDLAGNFTTASKVFSVNRYGTNFVVSDDVRELIHQYLSSGQDVTIRAINVNKIVNSEVTVTVNDKMISLNEGTDYTVNVVSEAGEESWYEYNYVIDKDVFSEEGYYNISITATDAAGNTSTIENDAHVEAEKADKIDFYIDTIAPTITITGADEGAIYQEGTKEITVRVEDRNLDQVNPENALTIKVNGETLNLSDPSVSVEANSGIITVRFTVSGEQIDIEVTAVDLAGTPSQKGELSFRLNAGLLLRWYSNKPVFFGSLGGFAAVLAGIIFAIVKRKKKD